MARSRGRFGPPRKAEHRTGASALFARAVAASLPGVEVTTDRGETSFSVGGEAFLSVEDEGDQAIVWSASEPEEAWR